MFDAILDMLFRNEGAPLRVRGLLALGFTGIGGAFLLVNQEMPPDAYNIMWTGSVAFYFGNRGAARP